MTSQELLRFYTSFKGRATRYDFNVRYAVVVFIGAVIAMGVDFFVINDGVLSLEMTQPVSNFWTLLVAVPTFAVVTRRLHDLGYAGWWQAVVYILPIFILGFLSGLSGAASSMDIMTTAGQIGLLQVLFVYLAFFLFISIKRGTVGANKYGHDPLEVTHV